MPPGVGEQFGVPQAQRAVLGQRGDGRGECGQRIGHASPLVVRSLPDHRRAVDATAHRIRAGMTEPRRASRPVDGPWAAKLSGTFRNTQGEPCPGIPSGQRPSTRRPSSTSAVPSRSPS
ncbi:hypothetical protein CURTO8I2_80060 [Curtobacterium sp. 8I-2]|nr:hypothetical protein CURTO8I2_80060 [Curtobacterium sp. 8I-2]